MIFIIKQILTFIKVLHSDDGEVQIALAILLGMSSGFLPFLSLFGVLSLVCAIVFRIQFSVYLVSWIFFGLIALLFLYPIFNEIGYYMLSQKSLESLYTLIQESSIGAFSRFNETLVMGALLFFIIISVPLYFLFIFLIRKYRSVILNFLVKTKLVQIFKGSFLVKMYALYEKYKV